MRRPTPRFSSTVRAAHLVSAKRALGRYRYRADQNCQANSAGSSHSSSRTSLTIQAQWPFVTGISVVTPWKVTRADLAPGGAPPQEPRVPRAGSSLLPLQIVPPLPLVISVHPSSPRWRSTRSGCAQPGAMRMTTAASSVEARATTNVSGVTRSPASAASSGVANPTTRRYLGRS